MKLKNSAILLEKKEFYKELFSLAIPIGLQNLLIAQYWGKGDKQMVKNLLCKIMKWAFGISLVFFALAMFTPELLMRVYTPKQNLLKSVHLIFVR